MFSSMQQMFYFGNPRGKPGEYQVQGSGAVPAVAARSATKRDFIGYEHLHMATLS